MRREYSRELPAASVLQANCQRYSSRSRREKPSACRNTELNEAVGKGPPHGAHMTYCDCIVCIALECNIETSRYSKGALRAQRTKVTELRCSAN